MKSRRSYEIVKYVQEHKFCSLPELMEHFHVSVATIYRDVSELVAHRQLRKVHGGVAYVESNRENTTLHYHDRMVSNRENKHIIAEMALAEINDGDTIFLDSSTTVYYLSKLIQQSSLASLTIITNSLLIIQEFSLFPVEYSLISLGGSYNIQLNSFLGSDTMRQLHNVPFNKAFISAFGISPLGLFTRYEQHGEFLQEVIALANTRYLLLDGEKFDRTGAVKIAPLRSITKIISDAELPGYI